MPNVSINPYKPSDLFYGTLAKAAEPDLTPQNASVLFAYIILNWNLNKILKYSPTSNNP